MDPVQWERFHAQYHEVSLQAGELRRDLADSRRGVASFESLFRISPIPIMEQDYTRVEEWMEGLRRRGVESIRQWFGDDTEAIRAVVPLVRIVSANPAAVHAVGLPLEDLIGPIDPRIVNEESLPSWLAQFEAVWNRHPEAHAAFTAATPDGRSYDAESTLAAPVIDGEPDFSRAVFTLVDVTLHRSEERRMGETIAAKNRFLASVSHEIRTPLTAIVGFGQLLEEDETMAEDDRRLMVTSIVQQAQEVSDLVEDLLVAVRAEEGEINVDATQVDVMEQIDRTLAAGGSFTTNVALESPSVPVVAIADPARVRQILRNLLTNAERYGGPEVSVTVAPGDRWVTVDVSDNGPGLPPDEWEPIFDLYHRAHQERDRPESVGIGLAISRHLAELMGGSLRYTREADRSVFRLSLQTAQAG
jgi:signal transduction histidine kinase